MIVCHTSTILRAKAANSMKSPGFSGALPPAIPPTLHFCKSFSHHCVIGEASPLRTMITDMGETANMIFSI